MNDRYKIGGSYLLSLNIDFASGTPVMNMELFNAESRKEIKYQCPLTNIDINSIQEEQEVFNTRGIPVMRVRGQKRLNVNIESVIEKIDINNL